MRKINKNRLISNLVSIICHFLNVNRSFVCIYSLMRIFLYHTMLTSHSKHGFRRPQTSSVCCLRQIITKPSLLRVQIQKVRGNDQGTLNPVTKKSNFSILINDAKYKFYHEISSCYKFHICFQCLQNKFKNSTNLFFWYLGHCTNFCNTFNKNRLIFWANLDSSKLFIRTEM